MKNKKIVTIATASIVCVAGVTGYLIHKTRHENTAQDLLAGLPSAQSLLTDFPAALPASAPNAQPASPPSQAAIAVALPKSASNDAPPFAKQAKSFARVNSVGSNVAQEAFDKGDYKTAIIAQYEGYRGQYYPDNKGYAIGYGFNAKFHTASYMAQVGKPLIPEQQQLTGFVSQAQQDSLQPPARLVNLSPGQAAGLIQAVLPQYDLPAVQALCGKEASVAAPCALYANLKPNEKAALTYNNYKRGSIPSELKAPLLAYAKSPTPENKQAVLAHIHYSYVSRQGQRIEDTRGTAGVQAMFESPEAFAALLGKNPTYVSRLSSQLPALASVKIDPAKPVDEQIPDPVGIAKEEAVEQGLHFGYEPVELAKPETMRPVYRGTGRMTSGWMN